MTEREKQETISSESPFPPGNADGNSPFPPGEAQTEASNTEGLVNVTDIDSEASDQRTAETQEPEVQEESPEPTEEFFNLLTSEFGELDADDELRVDGFYPNLTPDHIKDLQTPAKQIIHNLRKAFAIEQAKFQQQLNEKDKKVLNRERQLAEAEKEFLHRQQEFSALIDDPKIQEILKPPEGEQPDLYTEDGIKAKIKSDVAEAMRGFIEPFQKSSVERRKESAYRDFVEQNPEMQDPTFKREVLSVVNERTEAGQPISTQDAFRFVKLQKLEKEMAERKAAEQAARNQSARRVARTTSHGTPSGQEIPPEAKKNARSLAQWLKENPEAWRSIDSSR